MCGIVGLWNDDRTPESGPLTAMQSCLVHRGPDAGGSFREGPVGLGHRRLSIIDPEGGTQPLFSEDGSVVVVFNGEIYNHRSLRADLEVAGHRFDTDADTEVLVHQYEERGVEFVADLEGMFALALYDRDAERLVLARDGFGIKPMIFADDDDGIAFASELQSLFEAPVSLGGLDDSAVTTYFALGYIPAPQSIFRNVRKLRPGERVVVDADGVRRTCFSRPEVSVRDPGIETAATVLRSRLETAVEKRLMSDVPLGAFLSGGIDSSVVVTLLADLVDDPVQTFTVGFEESRFDEAWAGRHLADHVGTDHTEFTCSVDTVRDAVPDVLSRLGEPMADPSLIPTHVVARETSDEVTVALSGDAGDELFAGYDKHRAEYLSKYYRGVPESLRRGLVEPVLDRLPASRGSWLGDVGRKLHQFTAGGESELARRHVGWLRTADDAALAAVQSDADPLVTATDSVRVAEDSVRTFLPAARQDSLTVVQGIDTRHSLPDQLLTKVDLASMYNSLEVRVPFLDPGVVEYVFSLPRSYVMTPWVRKRVLKRAFADELPDAIRNRSKQGFDIPVGEWFKGPLASEFERVVDSLETDVLDPAGVRATYEDHCAGRRERGKFLWSVYVFARWHSRLRERGVLTA